MAHPDSLEWARLNRAHWDEKVPVHVASDFYDARHALPEPESFDVVYTTWGTIGWLPDAAEWARIIAWFLKPGGRLYFADGHPSACVIDDADLEKPTAMLDGGPSRFPTATPSPPFSTRGSPSTLCTSTTPCRGRCFQCSSSAATACGPGRARRACLSA